MADMLFPCTLVGSYPQPDWLIDRKALAGRFPPRTRAPELWRVSKPFLEEALRDATRLAVYDQLNAGIDIVTDGEMRRESYSNFFATALDGIDHENPGEALDRSGEPVKVPRVVGPLKRTRPVCVEDVRFLRSLTTKPIKYTVPGPFTMSQQAQNQFYATDRECALAYAAALNEEIKDLFAAGADIIQIDEPYMQARAAKAEEYGIEALNRALEGVQGKTCVHICFGYAALIHHRPSAYSFLPQLARAKVNQVSIETAQSNLDCSILKQLPDKEILLGVIDLSTPNVETVDVVKERVRRALPYIDPERVVLAPDCGMKYLARDVAYGKLLAMANAAKELRKEMGRG
ncbi:MAG: 5-methyltetrahydropteroyltriglutamate--homocysteine methyltransferase [Steroidobacteraceae bacterium]|nr:5-methyltetrahydropteroyltriglutamate--homocysteine methyltransferase [Steroidobacteraceae bacterium]